MALKQVIDIYELLSSAKVSGKAVADFFKSEVGVDLDVKSASSKDGSTDFVTFKNKASKNATKSLGIIGRLGGVGARPVKTGLLSDADGAIVALSVALKLAQMEKNGDLLDCQVVCSTQITPKAPCIDGNLAMPVDNPTMNEYEMHGSDAYLVFDTSRGNDLINHKGFAISQTAKEGYLLRYSPDLLRIYEQVTGLRAVTFGLSTQDLLPYGHGIRHINSIAQPNCATKAPVVCAAITAYSLIPGIATGASQEVDLAVATRFALEVAKDYGRGLCSFYDEEEFSKIKSLYGELNHLQERR